MIPLLKECRAEAVPPLSLPLVDERSYHSIPAHSESYEERQDTSAAPAHHRAPTTAGGSPTPRPAHRRSCNGGRDACHAACASSSTPATAATPPVVVAGLMNWHKDLHRKKQNKILIDLSGKRMSKARPALVMCLIGECSLKCSAVLDFSNLS